MGFATNQGGDIRSGLFPLAMAVAFTLLATCAQAVLRVHAQQSRMVTVGGWWTTLALLGPAGFFGGVAVGAMLGLDEETLGGFAILPVASMAFGILTLPIATTILALAVRRSGQLPSRASASLLVAGWVPPVLMVFGGLAEGTAESLGSAALAATFFGAWLVTGSAVRPRTRTTVNESRR
ncbi:MAG TPA: hypothetical protein VMM13_14465 [Euzebya sp.]|nr:hypothetical protein [Euzebya sp.]